MSDHGPNKYRVTKADGSQLPAGEPYFVLRGQDEFARFALSAYRYQLRVSGYPKDALDHLQEHIDEMKAWEPKKRPD